MDSIFGTIGEYPDSGPGEWLELTANDMHGAFNLALIWERAKDKANRHLIQHADDRVTIRLRLAAVSPENGTSTHRTALTAHAVEEPTFPVLAGLVAKPK